MIIKDDKAVEPLLEQIAENPPPYSAAPQVRIAVVDQAGASPSQSQSNVVFRPRGSSTASSTAVAGPLPTSDSSVYSGSTSSSTYRPVDLHSSVLPPPDVPRTSYLRIQRKNTSISERIVVDPYLPLSPEACQNVINDRGSAEGRDVDDDDEDYGPRFGSPGPAYPDLRNVRLECKDTNISAEVWIVGVPTGDIDKDDVSTKRKAGIDVRTKNGFVHVKIQTSPASPSLSLRAASKNGSIRIVLPRTFSGPLTTRTQNGWVTLSPGLAACTTVFSEVRGMRKSFVGDFVESGYGKGSWQGSSVNITCENGRIKLCYLDEDAEKLNSGFFGRFFN